jgi:hypothetical protein
MKKEGPMFGVTVIGACRPVLIVENDEIIIGLITPVTAIMGVKVVIVVVVVARSSSFVSIHWLICLSQWSLLRPMRLPLMRAIMLMLLSLHPLPPPLLLLLLLHRLQPRMLLTIPRKKRLRGRRQGIRRR